MTRLLEWLVGPRVASDVLGDLAEMRSRRAEASRLRDAVWFYRELMRILGYACLQRVANLAPAFRLAFPGPRGSVNELKQVARSLIRSPWYAASVLGILGLTGSLAIAAFTVADGVLFKPPPYPKPEQLFTASGPGGYVLSVADFESWRGAAPEAEMAMFQHVFTSGAVGTVSPAPVRAAAVGANFFSVLGQYPIIGAWGAQDFEPGPQRRRVMISYALWRSHFGGRRDIAGQHLDIAGAADHQLRLLPALEVAGVLPPDFIYPDNSATPDVLLPLSVPPNQRESRNDAVGSVLIRTDRDPGSLPDRLLAAYGPLRTNDGDKRAMTVSVHPLSPFMRSFQQDSLRSAFAASLILMLLGVINVSSLAVLRAEERTQELSLRLALGATRGDLFRLALIDSAPLVLAGMALSLILAPWAVRIAVALMPAYIVFLKTPAIDWRVGAFWMGLAVFTLGSCACTRLLLISPARLLSKARAGGSRVARGRFGQAAIGTQVALAFTVLMAGVLVIGSLHELWKQPIGYPLDNRVLIEVSHRMPGASGRPAVVGDLVDRLRAVRGIQRVAVVGGGSFLARSRQVVTFELPAGVKPGREGVWTVAGDYFDLMTLAPTMGRLFAADDFVASPSVAVISEQVARRYFPDRPAVGGFLKTRRESYEVIGVVRDIQLSGLADVSGGQVYMPGVSAQARMVLLTEGTASIPDTVAAVLAAKTAGVMRVQSFTEAIGGSVKITTFRSWLFGAFSLVALAIVAVGIFGIVAMSVARRTRELAIRSALGAQRRSLVTLFVREQIIVVVAGLVAGGCLAAWTTRLMKSYLYVITVNDPRFWLLAAATLVAVALAGALIPARRASRIDPARALNGD